MMKAAELKSSGYGTMSRDDINQLHLTAISMPQGGARDRISERVINEFKFKALGDAIYRFVKHFPDERHAEDAYAEFGKMCVETINQWSPETDNPNMCSVASGRVSARFQYWSLKMDGMRQQPSTDGAKGQPFVYKNVQFVSLDARSFNPETGEYDAHHFDMAEPSVNFELNEKAVEVLNGVSLPHDLVMGFVRDAVEQLPKKEKAVFEQRYFTDGKVNEKSATFDEMRNSDALFDVFQKVPHKSSVAQVFDRAQRQVRTLIMQSAREYIEQRQIQGWIDNFGGTAGQGMEMG